MYLFTFNTSLCFGLQFISHQNLICDAQKGHYAVCGQRRPWSTCALVHADLGLRFQLTESMDTAVYVDEHRMLESDCTYIIATDKSGYPHNIFLISQRIHMLRVLIRSASPRRGASNEYPQHIFYWEIRKISAFFGWKKAPYLLLWYIHAELEPRCPQFA